MKRRLVIMAGAACVLGLAVAAAGCGGSSSSTATTAAATGAAATGAAAGGGSAAPMKLQIGISAALSGPYAAYDEPLLNGMEFAAKEINAAGGPVSVEIVSKDNKGDSTLTATTTQELLDAGVKIQVLTTADPSIAQGQLISAAGGIASDGDNTAPAIVSDSGPRVFSFVFGDNGQASAGAEYACKQGYKTAYTLGSPEIPYTKNIPLYFADAFAHDCGGKVIGEDTYKIGQTEYGSQVTKIQNLSPQPDVIYSPIFVSDSGVFLKQLRSAGVTIPFVTTDGNDTSLFVDSGGSAVDGAVYTTHGFPVPGSPMAQFKQQYTQVMGKAPESNVIEAIGRDNVYALVQAVQDAGSVDPDAVLAAVLKLKDLQLLTGKMTMDPATRIPIKEVTLVKMDGTTFTFLETITPTYIAPAK